MLLTNNNKTVKQVMVGIYVYFILGLLFVSVRVRIELGYIVLKTSGKTYNIFVYKQSMSFNVMLTL